MIREDSIQIPFRYAAGKTSSRFLVALRDERQILGARCSACRRVICPARSFCPNCGDDTGELVEVGPYGTLVCWTKVPGFATFGLVRLDGADTAMLHRLRGPPSTWRVGARVHVLFSDTRVGSILDLEGFEPVEEES